MPDESPVNSIKLFLSTVTSEFEPYRLAVKDELVGQLGDIEDAS